MVQRLAASWPWERGRLRFRIARGSTLVDKEEIPKYVQIDTRIVDQDGKVWRSAVGNSRRRGLLCLSLLILIVHPFSGDAAAQSSVRWIAASATAPGPVRVA